MKTLYRTRQFGMSIITRIASKKEPLLIKGTHSLYQIIDLLEQSGKKHVLIVTTPGFIRRGSLNDFFEKLTEHDIKMTIFSEVSPDPTVECVEETVLAYQSGNCEAIVAIGGGSVIDCAKMAGARIVRPNMTIRAMKGTLKIRKQLPDFYAVPTTAGTGSEATAAAVVTDTINGTHYKYPVNDLCLIPKYAVLDPELTIALPSHITAATGIDALTHAIEAYTNRFASSKTKTNALEAVRLLYENLPLAYQDGTNIKARENMLLGSYYAGIAITNNFVGYVHAIAHAIGGLYGVTHGVANAILLPHIMEQYGSSAHKSLAALAKAAGIKAENDAKSAELFIESIRKLNREMNIPERFEMLQKKDFSVIIDRAMSEANPMYPTPCIWNPDDFETLLRKLV